MREFFEKLDYMIKSNDPRITPYLNPVRIRTKQHPAEHLPPAIIEAYENLYIKAYGTNAPFIGDPNKIHESGKAYRGRISTGETEKRGGAISKGSPHSKKIPILDERAFNLKAKFDKKIRKLAREMNQALADPKSVPSPVRCPGCGSIQEDHFRFCSRCGTRLKGDK